MSIDSLLERAEELSSDAERVTQAKLRRGRRCRSGQTLGLITLDNGEDHTKPNTFGFRGRCWRSTPRSTRHWPTTTVDAIGVTGKPFILAAGADLTSDPEPVDPTPYAPSRELGHAVFRKLGEGGKPSFGFINGLALGGGLEVALHCTYRTVMDSAPALGLPEVMLGLVPGWGGAYLVPNLLGADKAVTLAIENPLNNGRTLRRSAGLRVRPGRRGLRWRRLPGAVAALGGRGAHRATWSSSDPRSTAAPAWDAAIARAEGIVAAEDRRCLPRGRSGRSS